MSMTREEAIKSLQNIIEYWTYKPTEVEAAKMAISALRPITREQVEKMRGEWLNFYNDFSTAECSKCGELFDVSDTNENLKVLFDAFKKYYQFCPSCGAPMTDKAVDMVMKRLEALYGQENT